LPIFNQFIRIPANRRAIRHGRLAGLEMHPDTTADFGGQLAVWQAYYRAIRSAMSSVQAAFHANPAPSPLDSQMRMNG